MPRSKREIAELAREERRINRQFGAAVKAAREGRGLTYRAAADLFGMSLSTLQQIEAGERSTRLAAAWTIARSLSINIDRVCRDRL